MPENTTHLASVKAAAAVSILCSRGRNMQDTAAVDDGSCKITVKVLAGLESVSWQVYESENLLTGI